MGLHLDGVKVQIL